MNDHESFGAVGWIVFSVMIFLIFMLILIL